MEIVTPKIDRESIRLKNSYHVSSYLLSRFVGLLKRPQIISARPTSVRGKSLIVCPKR